MSRATLSHVAVAACQEYEYWASEVRRLTIALAELRCPNEAWGEADEEGPGSRQGESCFQTAKAEYVPDGPHPDSGDRPRTLDEIAVEVKGCRACLELVALIRARRNARNRWGVAKRKVRAAGKRAAGGQP